MLIDVCDDDQGYFYLYSPDELCSGIANGRVLTIEL